MVRIKADRARRIALAAQGFANRKPSRVDVGQLRRVMETMAVLQLDSVNVVCRSHYLPLLARLGPYDRAKADRFLYRSGEYYEYLAHEASFTAQVNEPLLRHRTAERRWKSGDRFAAENADYLAAVKQEVADNGPVSIKTLSDPGKRTGPWWGMPKGKIALEYLYVRGELSIAYRDQQFVTHYDLPERVLRPEVLAAAAPEVAEARRELLMVAARASGIGTGADLADYFRMKVTSCRPLLADLVAEGRLEKVEVEGWDEPAYLHPEARQPRAIRGGALLSPFDPVIWYRPRAERLFNFFYRIEIYVPAPKRVYGYYVLPFLLDGELVGRVDLKADRNDSVLDVRAAHLESGRDAQAVAPPLGEALLEMGQWLGLDGVRCCEDGDLSRELAKIIRI